MHARMALNASRSTALLTTRPVSPPPPRLRAWPPAGSHNDEGVQAIAASLGTGAEGKAVLDATNPLSAFPGLHVRWQLGTSDQQSPLEQPVTGRVREALLNTWGYMWHCVAHLRLPRRNPPPSVLKHRPATTPRRRFLKLRQCS